MSKTLIFVAASAALILYIILTLFNQSRRVPIVESAQCLCRCNAGEPVTGEPIEYREPQPVSFQVTISNLTHE